MNNGQQQGQFYNQNHGQNQGQGQNMRGGQPMGMGIKDEHNSMKNRVSRILYLPPHCHHLQRRRILSLTSCLSFSTHFLVSPLPYHHHNFFVLKIIKIPCPHPPMNFLKQIKQVFDTGSYNHSIGLGIREIFISLQQNGMQNINERAIRDVCMEMTDDGIIYSTIDEDHFLAT